MNSLRASFAPYWESIQRTLFPRLEQALGPLTEKQQQLVQTLEVIRIERLIPRYFRGAHSRFPGHALTPTGVMAIRCKQFHLPDL